MRKFSVWLEIDKKYYLQSDEHLEIIVYPNDKIYGQLSLYGDGLNDYNFDNEIEIQLSYSNNLPGTTVLHFKFTNSQIFQLLKFPNNFQISNNSIRIKIENIQNKTINFRIGRIDSPINLLECVMELTNVFIEINSGKFKRKLPKSIVSKLLEIEKRIYSFNILPNNLPITFQMKNFSVKESNEKTHQIVICIDQKYLKAENVLERILRKSKELVLLLTIRYSSSSIQENDLILKNSHFIESMDIIDGKNRIRNGIFERFMVILFNNICHQIEMIFPEDDLIEDYEIISFEITSLLSINHQSQWEENRISNFKISENNSIDITILPDGELLGNIKLWYDNNMVNKIKSINTTIILSDSYENIHDILSLVQTTDKVYMDYYVELELKQIDKILIRNKNSYSLLNYFQSPNNSTLKFMEHFKKQFTKLNDMNVYFDPSPINSLTELYELQIKNVQFPNNSTTDYTLPIIDGNDKLYFIITKSIKEPLFQLQFIDRQLLGEFENKLNLKLNFKIKKNLLDIDEFFEWFLIQIQITIHSCHNNWRFNSCTESDSPIQKTEKLNFQLNQTNRNFQLILTHHRFPTSILKNVTIQIDNVQTNFENNSYFNQIYQLNKFSTIELTDHFDETRQLSFIQLTDDKFSSNCTIKFDETSNTMTIVENDCFLKIRLKRFGISRESIVNWQIIPLNSTNQFSEMNGTINFIENSQFSEIFLRVIDDEIAQLMNYYQLKLNVSDMSSVINENSSVITIRIEENDYSEGVVYLCNGDDSPIRMMESCVEYPHCKYPTKIIIGICRNHSNLTTTVVQLDIFNFDGQSATEEFYGIPLIVEFDRWETERNITLVVRDDDISEFDEFFQLRLTHPKINNNLLIIQRNLSVIIMENDNPSGYVELPSYLQQNSSTIELSEYCTNCAMKSNEIKISILRFGGTLGEKSISWKLIEMTKNSNESFDSIWKMNQTVNDLYPSNGEITIFPKEIQKSLNIFVRNDEIYENDEFFYLLVNDEGSYLRSTKIKILANDFPIQFISPIVTRNAYLTDKFSPNDLLVSEGEIIELTLYRNCTNICESSRQNVKIQIEQSSTIDDEDWEFLNETITLTNEKEFLISFNENEEFVSFSINILDDDIAEYEEIIIFQLLECEGDSIIYDPQQIRVHIQPNDDIGGNISLESEKEIQMNENVEKWIRFKWNLPQSTSNHLGNLRINWNIIDAEEREAKNDFVQSSADNEYMEVDIKIKIKSKSEDIPEKNEEFIFQLTSVTVVDYPMVDVKFGNMTSVKIRIKANDNPNGIIKIVRTNYENFLNEYDLKWIKNELNKKNLKTIISLENNFTSSVTIERKLSFFNNLSFSWTIFPDLNIFYMLNDKFKLLSLTEEKYFVKKTLFGNITTNNDLKITKNSNEIEKILKRKDRSVLFQFNGKKNNYGEIKWSELDLEPSKFFSFLCKISSTSINDRLSGYIFSLVTKKKQNIHYDGTLRMEDSNNDFLEIEIDHVIMALAIHLEVGEEKKRKITIQFHYSSSLELEISNPKDLYTITTQVSFTISELEWNEKKSFQLAISLVPNGRYIAFLFDREIQTRILAAPVRFGKTLENANLLIGVRNREYETHKFLNLPQRPFIIVEDDDLNEAIHRFYQYPFEGYLQQLFLFHGESLNFDDLQKLIDWKPENQFYNLISKYETMKENEKEIILPFQTINDDFSESLQIYRLRIFPNGWNEESLKEINELNDFNLLIYILPNDNSYGNFYHNLTNVSRNMVEENEIFNLTIHRSSFKVSNLPIKIYWTILTLNDYNCISNCMVQNTNDDFVSSSGFIEFDLNEKEKNLIINPINDLIPELKESFIILFSLTDKNFMSNYRIDYSQELIKKFNDGTKSIPFDYPISYEKNLPSIRIDIEENDYPKGILTFLDKESEEELMEFDKYSGSDFDKFLQKNFADNDTPIVLVNEEDGYVKLTIIRCQGSLGDIEFEWRTETINENLLTNLNKMKSIDGIDEIMAASSERRWDNGTLILQDYHVSNKLR
ncbi:hypothetical protein SNEBB_004494 [Seison nebaliae]|nr:hypothetical protein SNEBB_004494 [Seison nebaliae]